MDIDEFGEKSKDLARELRVTACPIWQCGGQLAYLEKRLNWQTPDLMCSNCGALWLLQDNKKIEN